VLKFLVQTFYQPLFSISFPCNKFFSLHQFFPSIILFPSKSFPHQKAQSKIFFLIFKGKKHPSPQSKKPKAKPKVQKSKSKALKGKGPFTSFFYSSKQGGAMGRGVTL
jgi:hypothetical protein